MYVCICNQEIAVDKVLNSIVPVFERLSTYLVLKSQKGTNDDLSVKGLEQDINSQLTHINQTIAAIEGAMDKSRISAVLSATDDHSSTALPVGAIDPITSTVDVDPLSAHDASVDIDMEHVESANETATYIATTTSTAATDAAVAASSDLLYKQPVIVPYSIQEDVSCLVVHTLSIDESTVDVVGTSPLVDTAWSEPMNQQQQHYTELISSRNDSIPSVRARPASEAYIDQQYQMESDSTIIITNTINTNIDTIPSTPAPVPSTPAPVPSTPAPVPSSSALLLTISSAASIPHEYDSSSSSLSKDTTSPMPKSRPFKALMTKHKQNLLSKEIPSTTTTMSSSYSSSPSSYALPSSSSSSSDMQRERATTATTITPALVSTGSISLDPIITIPHPMRPMITKGDETLPASSHTTSDKRMVESSATAASAGGRGLSPTDRYNARSSMKVVSSSEPTNAFIIDHNRKIDHEFRQNKPSPTHDDDDHDDDHHEDDEVKLRGSTVNSSVSYIAESPVMKLSMMETIFNVSSSVSEDNTQDEVDNESSPTTTVTRIPFSSWNLAPSVQGSTAPRPSREHYDGSTPSREHYDDSTPSREHHDDSTPSIDHYDGSTPSREHHDDSTPLKEDHHDGSTPSIDHNDGLTQSKEYHDDSTPFKDHYDGSTPSREYHDDSTPLKDHYDDSTPSREDYDATTQSLDNINATDVESSDIDVYLTLQDDEAIVGVLPFQSSHTDDHQMAPTESLPTTIPVAETLVMISSTEQPLSLISESITNYQKTYPPLVSKPNSSDDHISDNRNIHLLQQQQQQQKNKTQGLICSRIICTNLRKVEYFGQNDVYLIMSIGKSQYN